MKKRFAEEYFFIREAIHYLQNGNNTQKKEYTEKLLNRYGNYIKRVIGKKIKIEFQLKEDAFNEFCCNLFDPKELKKYKGKSSFKTYIYTEIVAAIGNVMPESERAKGAKRQEKNKKEREMRSQKKKDDNDGGNEDQAIYEESTKQKHKSKTKAKKYTEDDINQYSHSTLGIRILQENLEEGTFTRQDNPEHLLGIKDLRAKQSQAIAVSILKMSQIHPKDIRIFVMNLCDFSWEEIAECMGMDVDLAKKRYNREDGIQDKFASLFKKTLQENYKIDFKTLSSNFNALIDIE